MNSRVKLLIIIVGCFSIGVAAALFVAIKSPSEQTVLIGGPFEVTDHTGKRVTEKDLKGKLSLIYFGFSHCPDICPGDLQLIAAALDDLGPKAEQVNAVFVSIDPERDTKEVLAQYLNYFHKDIRGFTGTVDEIRNMAKAYRVYYSKVETPDSHLEYLMNHSTITYLMDRNGKYLTHFGHATDPKQMVAKISKHL